MPRIIPFCFFATALAAVTFFSGCTLPFQSSDGDGSGYTFTFSIDSNPKTLDPQSATDSASMTIIRNLYEGLFEMNEEGNLQYAAAKSVAVSSDGLVYTVILNDDYYWYYDKNGDDVIDDGETWSLTAADYVYAFQRMFNPETQSPYRETFACLENAQAIIDGTADYTEIGVRAVSDTQLQFILDYANTRFLSLLSTTAAMPCSEKFFQQTKGRYGLDQSSVASCGAFYLRLWFYDSYGSDNLIYMRRNSANTDARSVYPTELTVHIRNSQQSVADDLTSSESDLIMTSIYSTDYENEDNYVVNESEATTLGLIFNPNSNVFSNQKIRRALSIGIDRSSIGENSDGDLTGTSGIIAPAVYWNGTNYRESYPETVITYDEATAVQYMQVGMAELGIESLDSTKILMCRTLMDCENLHDIIQTWQDIFGFYIGIEEVIESEYWERISDGDYTIAVYGITGSSNDPASVLEQFASGNVFQYVDEEVDQQIIALGKCQTDSELLEQCAALEQEILNDDWFIPIFYKKQYCIASAGNTDLNFDPFAQTLNLRSAKHFG